MPRKTEGPKALDSGLRARAKVIASDYRIVLEKSTKCGYVGWAIEMPTVFGAGETPNACEQDTRANLVEAVFLMLGSGKRPPASSDRTMQINIRVTQEEKLQLEVAARENGFRGLSDFLRAMGLRACG